MLPDEMQRSEDRQEIPVPELVSPPSESLPADKSGTWPEGAEGWVAHALG